VILTVLLSIGSFGAVSALVMTVVNLRLLKPAPTAGQNETGALGAGTATLVSICIPARNEEANIEACVRSLLVGSHRAIEVLVYNDQSTDRTGEILAALAASDPRVRIVPTLPLGDGWNGKQFGCQRCGEFASGTWLLFTDADVRFEPDAIARTLLAASRARAELISTFPRQITATLGEKLVIPLIHFILLSYLPIARMRSTLDPAASAGCGQFLFVRTSAWSAAGGHTSFKDSMHDGIKLPRAVRRVGLRTDLFDGTDLCHVRMYQGFAATWRGFTKNAFEGLGSVGLLLFITVLHALGQLLPWLVLAAPVAQWLADFTRLTNYGEWPLLDYIPTAPHYILATIAACSGLIGRLLLARRFCQSLISALLHPVGITLMTLIQWHSLYLAKTGRRTWRGRGQGPALPVRPQST